MCLIEFSTITRNDGEAVMNGGGGDHEVRLRERVTRFPAFLNQQPPLEQNLFRDLENAAIEHGTHLVHQPVVQFNPAMGLVDKFDAKSNLGQGYYADVKLLQRAAGYEGHDFPIRPGSPQFRQDIGIQ